MGGHGALTLYLSSLLGGSKQYRSVSAFAPISNPSKCPWGENAFKGYLAGGVVEGQDLYDATELVKKLPATPVHVLIDYVRYLHDPTFLVLNLDQGTGDKFYKNGQLLPENFLKAARDQGYDEVQVRVRDQEGYDHGYYFVSVSDVPYNVPTNVSQRYQLLVQITSIVSANSYSDRKH